MAATTSLSLGASSAARAADPHVGAIMRPPDVHRPQLWFLDLTVPLDSSVLSDHEVERAARFRFERDRRRFVARRVWLRRILAHYAGTTARALRFAEGACGKPTLVEYPDLRFSASSSGEDGVLAVGSGELGVDLERAESAQGLTDVAARFFAPDEVAQLSSRLDFYRCWSRKEAYVKAIGRGLSFPLDSFAVDVSDVPNPLLLRSSLRPNDVNNVRIVDLSSASGGYTAALVVLDAGAFAPVEPERRWTDEL